MEIDSPLQNPHIQDLISPDVDTVEGQPEQTSPIPAQQPLPIFEGSDWRSKLDRQSHKFLYQLSKREQLLEMMPFWRTEATAFAITSSFLINLGILIFSILNFAKLPPQARFFFDHSTNRPILADKSIFLVAPIVVLLCEVVLLRLIYDLFKLDRQLSQAASWLLTVINIVILFGAVQIFKLSL